MDLLLYNLQLQFSDTDCGSYLLCGIDGPFESPHSKANCRWTISAT